MNYVSDKYLLKKQNYNYIRELVRISFSLGVNLTSPTRFKESLKILNVIFTISSIYNLYGHVYFIMSDKKFNEKCESFCLILQTSISIVKMIYFLFTQREFAELIYMALTHKIFRRSEMFQKDFGVNEKLKMKVNEMMRGIWRNTRTQLLFYTICCICIGSLYIVTAVVKNLYNYIIGAVDYEPAIPFPVKFPFWSGKEYSFPGYPIIFYLSVAGDHLASLCAVSFDGVFIVLCLHCVGLLKGLKLMIDYATDPLLPKELREEYLINCIKHYDRVAHYVERINRLYKHVSISQFLMSLVIWAFVIFQMSVGLESEGKFTVVRMFFYIAAAGYEIVIYCMNGQRLVNASDEISTAFYHCIWYNESKKFQKLLQMTILRTNRVFNLKISWFFDMTLPTLMSMMRTSGSYFLLIRNLRGLE